MSRIIVKNLPDRITKEKLLQLFSEKGLVTDIQLKYTKDGKFRKFAFIGFQKPEFAEAAKQALNNSFINTSKIQIETCAELGDPNKPRAWSKYAPENTMSKKRGMEDKESKNKKVSKHEKNENNKIKDPVVKALLKDHEKDILFSEFMEVNAPNIKLPSLNDSQNDEFKKLSNIHNEEEIEEECNKSILANEDITDLEYIKLKTGKDLNLKSEENTEKNIKKSKSLELFTIKLTGLPLKVKKSHIREFLKPIKPFTIRRALKMKGVAYCGFKTEKEMKQSLLKNRSFLDGKRIIISAQKKKNPLPDIELESKWKNENERLQGLETIAESGRIFIRNLSYTATEEDLKQILEKYGPLTEFSLPIDSFTRKNKGFGIVTFLIPEHACQAFNALDGTVFQGRMLHLLPALPIKGSEEEETLGESFKSRKLKKEKAKANSCENWNTFFIGEDALAETIAATYNTTKDIVLDDKQSGVAVRLALGETQFIKKMKEFLEENDVNLDAFENLSNCSRSNTIILVKNLPFGTKVEEIRERFSKFGELKKIVLPPNGAAALVEYLEPSEAKIAFRRLAYSKFKHVPIYLEWAPEKIFTKDSKSKISVQKEKENEGEDTKNKMEDTEHIPEEGTTIFVKNLNFETDEQTLQKHFEICGPISSVTIARKKNPNHLEKKLSMGYGFVEFSSKEFADKALKTLQFTTLDGHRVELKRSHRTLAPQLVSSRKISQGNEKPSTKILVRNVPFQATQKELCDLFKVFGEIKDIRLPKKMVGTGSHRGFCFVEYNTVQDAKRAFEALSQSTHLYGRRLVLEWAAMDENIEKLREKTVQQYKAGTFENTQKKNKITINEELLEE